MTRGNYEDRHPSDEWRCFHCGELFTDRKAAARHFGFVSAVPPGCMMDAEGRSQMVQAYLKSLPTEARAKKAKELATKIDEALALVPQSPEGVDVALGDMLFIGPEVSDLLHQIAADAS